ncbi:MAG: flagellar hook-basal body complex protein FliE [Acetobacteraceae bacterium]|jgi:flagellar hook-basal body complex protein FliE
MTPLAPIGQVLSAYSTSRTRPAAETGETGFGTMVADAAQSALNTVRQSEQTTVNAVAGKADVQDVVTALGDAEVTMQTVVAVRDKILGAYNDIMKMSI